MTSSYRNVWITLLGIKTFFKNQIHSVFITFSRTKCQHLIKFCYLWHQSQCCLTVTEAGFTTWRSVLADVLCPVSGLWLRSPVWGRQTTDTRVCSDWDLESGECCSLLQLTGEPLHLLWEMVKPSQWQSENTGLSIGPWRPFRDSQILITQSQHETW